MRTGLELIVNTSFNDIQWLQATLPVRDGGLGLRRVVSLASSAYLASAAATLELQMAILGGSALVPDVVFDDLLLSRQQTLPTVMSPLPTRPVMGKVRPAGRMRPSDSFCAARRES